MTERENLYLFEDKKFDIEHGLSLYASSFCVLPASLIYEKKIVRQYQDVIDTCHIYMIGYLPRVVTERAFRRLENLHFDLTVGTEKKEIVIPIPEGMTFHQEDDDLYLKDKMGKKFVITNESISPLISDMLDFKVVYIGQAYGDNGSRNALDRLLKHETLQRVALKGAPQGYVISLLLLEVQTNTQLVTLINPRAKIKDDGTRIQAGYHKLYNTTDAERVSLFEASFIRYFSPEFNKEFKNSFPSTNLKVLNDCYDKDFSALFTEILIEELPFRLYSDKVKPQIHHLAHHDLQTAAERKAFFHSEADNGD
ncbi:MAG: hypothetical protein GYB58_21840 [Gammaproteobacteria bacterium]|nr:hypothetical protein [Gammaproteobacteria bacterium]